MTVDGNATGVAEFLGDSAPGTKATGLEKKIETHDLKFRVSSSEFRVQYLDTYTRQSNTRNSELGTRNLVYGFGIIPRNLPFFFSGLAGVLLFSAVFSGGSFSNGATASR